MEELSVTEFDKEVGELDLPALTILSEESSVFDAIEHFSRNTEGLIGVGSGGKLSGIVTEWDVIHNFDPNINPREIKLTDLMVENPVTLYNDNTLYEVMNVMGKRNFLGFPVCDDEGNATHIFNLQVIFNFLTSHFKIFLNDLGTLEDWDPTKVVAIFSEGFSYSATMNDDSSLHENYFLTPFERIPSYKLIKADLELPIGEAWKLILEAKSESIVATKNGTKLVGVLTLRDIIEKLLVNSGSIDLSKPLKDFMTKDPYSLMYKHPIGHGINHFLKYNFRHMVVVDEDRIPLKVVSLLEIFSHLVTKVKLN